MGKLVDKSAPDFLAKIQLAPNKWLCASLSAYQGVEYFHLRIWSVCKGKFTPWRTGVTLEPKQFQAFKRLIEETERVLTIRINEEGEEHGDE